MRVLPAAERKALRACTPADLVRIRYGAGTELAVVADHDGQSGFWLIYLTGPSAAKWLALKDDDLDTPVVSFGKEYCIEADQSALIEMQPSTLNSVAGSLMLCGAEWHLRAHVESSKGQIGARHYVWSSGALISPRPEFELTAFSKWSLYIDNDHCCGLAKSAPLMTFDCQSQLRAG